MIAVKLGGKEFVSHQTSQTSACTRRALTSRDAHHPTRARLVHWYGTVNSYGFVLAGVNDIHRYVYGVHQASRVILGQSGMWCKNTRSVVSTWSQLKTPSIGGLMSMVSTWRMIRSAVFVSVLVISVELAQPCMVLGYGAFMGCFTAPAVLQRAATTTHLTAHVPSCALG